MTPAQMSRRKFAAFAIITLLIPVALAAILELGLRALDYGGNTQLFEATSAIDGGYIVPGRNVARRYFPGEQNPPTPPVDAFLAAKPANSLRIFVMGESSAAGFPYPSNGTFSRILRDALQDVLPRHNVEVINLGMAATNSYAIADLADDVVEHQPDGVIIYGGHNEYYGALGAGSTETLGAFPGFVRLYLRLQQFRSFVLIRNSVNAAFALVGSKPSAAQMEADPSRMESVVRDQSIELGGATYARGKRQYESNLRSAIGTFKAAGIPVFIGSTPSNLRDQRPFGSRASPAGLAAQTTFDSATAALARNDTTRAALQFAHARDLDPIRFRAPTEFRPLVERIARETGSHYVPVVESFASRSLHGIPGSNLFLEHVHPDRQGYALLAEVFFEALAAKHFLGREPDWSRIAPWGEYSRRTRLTALDERIAHHTVKTVTTRWPFLPLAEQLDYRGTYRPVDFLDSLAFASSRGGIPWPQAKSEAASFFLRSGNVDAAVAEYDGLIRDAPRIEIAFRLAGNALLSARQTARARPYLERAYTLSPNALNSFSVGVLSLQEKNPQGAIPFLDQAVRLEPTMLAALYQLSLAYALSRDLERARDVAARLARVNPRYPGLEQWMEALGVGPG